MTGTDGGERLLPGPPVPDVDTWLEGDGGLAYAEALDRDPDEIIAAVDEAGLRGRGGAGFPTGRKWRGVLETAGEADAPVYLVCNAAEGEPGTFKDRMLLRHNPYAVLEGMLVAMHAVGAVEAHVGIKERFTPAVDRLEAALDELVADGWARAEDIHIVEGPEDYLFGEEKAMLEVIEGKLAMPRILPPYQTGLYATTTSPNPTVVNNVETFAHVTGILAHGPDWFRQVGTEASPGTMPMTVVGDVASPGVYELPLGTSLRTLLEDIAGAEDVKAVYSGTSNAVITTDMLDTPLCFDAMSEAGSGLGSGGFIVYDGSRSIVDVLAVLTRFLAEESCGQCNACVLGTAEMADLLERMQRGQAARVDLESLLRRSSSVTDQNRCYLPVGAQATVTSTVDVFEDELIATVEAGRATPADLPVPLIDDIDEEAGEVTWTA